MGTGSIQLARVFGIRIGASPSWFVVALIFIVWLSTAYDDQYGQTTGYIMAVASVALFFLSLTLHELGHAWVARRNGIEIAGHRSVVLRRHREAQPRRESPGEEFRVSAAGPAVTLLIVVVSCVGGRARRRQQGLRRRARPARPPGRRAGRARLAGAGQRRALRLQPDPRLPARRWAHRPRDRVEAHRRPQPRHCASPRGSGRPSPTSSWGWASSCSSAATPAAGSGGSSWAGSWASRRPARSSRAASPSAWRA